MNVVILLLGFTAAVFAQPPAGNPYMKIHPCNKMTAYSCRKNGYIERKQLDATERFYNNQNKAWCTLLSAFYEACCTCIPYQVTERPVCKLLFKHSAGELLEQKTGDYHNTYPNPIGNFITKEIGFTCFSPTGYVQLDFTSQNDFGTQFNIQLHVSYSVNAPTKGEQVIFFTNDLCINDVVPTLRLYHTPISDEYTVQSDKLTISCSMGRHGTGNSAYTVNDVIKIRYVNGEMSVLITEENIHCTFGTDNNILKGFKQTMPGTVCPMKIGNMGTYDKKVCYKSIFMDRDCIKKE